MKNVIFCLLATILVTACNTRRGSVPRLAAIGIQGENTPQYTFRYDQKGNLVELSQHNKQDSNITTFEYDDTNRIAGITFSSQLPKQKPRIKAKARVTGWDKTGNITDITYYNDRDQPLRKACIRWKDGLPVAMKFSDSTIASTWNLASNTPTRKDVYIDSSKLPENEGSMTLRTTQYEYEDSVNPLKPFVNQLVASQSAAPATISPVGKLSDIFLQIGNKPASLVRIAEQEKAVCRQYFQEYECNTTYQYFYSYAHNNSFPDKAWVHVRKRGNTHLDTNTDFIMFYQYE
ncbi:hypothetical protein SAMN05660909_03202 [Chitinophaga terrae (ex Kim and Jung 2007)]|uniref:YD repeat-containing protein n=1 Tax=Chitinophaga terrae (ex Kim and Jung 2007) TaxID=408074 RepID=A0A1H4DMD7_9BACT|nr:hypothetical protein [Chitinophaga terrae (ex Kim and Jung 2007)]MDQ0107828.1 hypothetical protein [Chitinophaga terrae (ex Kim and Jung 2007)]GEP91002.1 hypothetical protein CTE07_26470 [Chitinophaga terrae (ex Kim and Jung 2007)]SEA73904.1 hypothetical protein SAMN05660909_03202 [Chitinophaga terrae (ex Kim and Jung 2007)]